MAQITVRPMDAAILGYLHGSKGKGLGAGKLVRSLSPESRPIGRAIVSPRSNDTAQERTGGRRARRRMARLRAK